MASYRPVTQYRNSLVGCEQPRMGIGALYYNVYRTPSASLLLTLAEPTESLLVKRLELANLRRIGLCGAVPSALSSCRSRDTRSFVEDAGLSISLVLIFAKDDVRGCRLILRDSPLVLPVGERGVSSLKDLRD